MTRSQEPHHGRLSPALFALALFLSGPAPAQTAITNGVPLQVPVDATLDNSFAIDVTDIDFGMIAVTGKNGETGQLTMETDGTFDDSANIDPIARVIARNAVGQPGILDISGALPNTVLFVRYSNVFNLSCGGCAGAPPAIIVSRIFDDMPDQQGSWSVDDANPDADAIPGQGVTSGGGGLTINIGATLRSDSAASDPYPPGDYEGTFDVTLEY